MLNPWTSLFPQSLSTLLASEAGMPLGVKRATIKSLTIEVSFDQNLWAPPDITHSVTTQVPGQGIAGLLRLNETPIRVAIDGLDIVLETRDWSVVGQHERVSLAFFPSCFCSCHLIFYRIIRYSLPATSGSENWDAECDGPITTPNRRGGRGIENHVYMG